MIWLDRIISWAEKHPIITAYVVMTSFLLALPWFLRYWDWVTR